MRMMVVLCLILVAAAVAASDNTDAVFARLQPGELAAVHQAVAQFRQTLSAVADPCGYQDLRAVIHTHSYLSHDSRGTLEQMVAGAQATGTRVVVLTDHPSREHDVLTEGFSGMHDGALFFPGAETRHLLIYSPRSLDLSAPPTLQALIDAVNAAGGMAFLSHVEQVRDLGLAGLAGMEIYNLHAQAIEAPGVFQLTAPGSPEEQARLLMLVQAVQQYPHETAAALSFRPDTYLRAFDELSQKYRLTGIAANDAHNSTGIIVKVAPQGMVVIEDLLGEQVGIMDASRLPLPGLVKPDARPGDVVFRLQVDPYDVSFGHVGTYVLVQYGRTAVPPYLAQGFLEALRAGHCYVGFDWIASPQGFRFSAQRGSGVLGIMGDEVALGSGLDLVTALPAEAVVRLYRNGVLSAEADARREMRWPVSQPGVYRVEAYVRLAGDLRPWVFSNPIYVR